MRRILASLLLLAGLAGLAGAALAAVNVGVYTLAARQITTAVTSEAQTPVTSLAGANAVTLDVTFAYGSGGTSTSVVVQTTFDSGTTWRDVARFDFTTATAVKTANLSGLTAKGVASYAALGSEGVTDGLLGDRLRAVVTSVGTYANTVLTVRASVR